jgi:transposase/putative transposase
MIVGSGADRKTEPNTHEMKAKRRRHDPEFKARVALEAIRGVKTIQEIAKESDVHPVQVSEWKKTMTQNAASAFGAGSGGTAAGDFDRERTQLHAKIGQLAVELDWLAKKSKPI